jgi:hypothetical protein
VNTLESPTNFIQSSKPVHLVHIWNCLRAARGANGGHSLTQRYASHYARLLMVTGRASEGLTFAQSALATHEVASGLKHPWTKDSARVTADALEALGRTQEAKALRERYGVTEPGKPKSS